MMISNVTRLVPTSHTNKKGQMCLHNGYLVSLVRSNKCVAFRIE